MASEGVLPVKADPSQVTEHRPRGVQIADTALFSSLDAHDLTVLVQPVLCSTDSLGGLDHGSGC